MITAFPRSMFSESELEVVRWILDRVDAPRAPTVKQIKDHRPRVLAAAGVRSETLESAHHNLYACNNICDIITNMGDHDRAYGVVAKEIVLPKLALSPIV